MIRQIAFALVLSLAAPLAVTADAQEPAPKPLPPAVVQLMVDVVISRHLNDKTLSSSPYTVALIPDNNRGSLRMGGDVPIPQTTIVPGSKEEGKPASSVASYGYRSIGTSIDVVSTAVAGGQYRVTLTIDESSIYPPDLAPPTAKTTGAPAFRSFKSTNTVALRDGQSLNYAMATDRLTGEVYRVTVKLTVVK